MNSWLQVLFTGAATAAIGGMINAVRGLVNSVNTLTQRVARIEGRLGVEHDPRS